MAGNFQHSGMTHEAFYSDEIVRRDGNDLIHYPLLAAQMVWYCMGENFGTRRSHSGIDRAPQRMPAEQYESAAKALYGPTSSPSELQLETIRHIDSSTETRHAFITMAPGTGKSGLYNISLAASALYGIRPQRTIVISPHNGLLAQHHQQTVDYFRALPISVSSFESSDIDDTNTPPVIDHSSLIFVSISAFHKLMKYHRGFISTWGIKRIVIDEYHNIISEIFRF
eukprot:scaffold4537_cov86-Skeletonema_dohrnii-CCMP3373.AAC.1